MYDAYTGCKLTLLKILQYYGSPSKKKFKLISITFRAPSFRMHFFTIVDIRQVNKDLSMKLEKKLPIPRPYEHKNNSAIQRLKIQNNGYLKSLMPNGLTVLVTIIKNVNILVLNPMLLNFVSNKNIVMTLFTKLNT